MTTSRAVARSSSMFGLPRRPSLAPAPTPKSPTTTSTTSTEIAAAVHATPASFSASSAASSSSSSPCAPPPTTTQTSSTTTDPHDAKDEPSPTHRPGNNDKIRRRSWAKSEQLRLPLSPRGAPESPSTAAATSTSTPTPAVAAAAAADADKPRRGLGRSPTMPPAHATTADVASPRSTVARDFALSVGAESAAGHANCSSLREQFLKIKERFSAAPSPRGATHADAATALLPRPASTGALPHTATTTTTTASLSSTGGGSGGGGVVAVAAERVLHELNERTRRCYPTGLLWAQHAHVERWYLEDNCFKGSMTCWTVENGAEIIARIARVVARRAGNVTITATPSAAAAAPATTNATTNAATARINPDISLQWIGRQLWAVTVSLPLTRAGELTNEHASLAQAIDDAIADESVVVAASASAASAATTSAATAIAAPSSSTTPNAPTQLQRTWLNPLVDGGTLVLPETTLATAAASEHGHDSRNGNDGDSAAAGAFLDEDAHALSSHRRRSNQVLSIATPSLEEQQQQTTTMTTTTIADDAGSPLASSVSAAAPDDHDADVEHAPPRAVAAASESGSGSTVLAEDEADVGRNGHRRRLDDDDHADRERGDEEEREEQEDEGATSRSMTLHEDGDTLSALPLSWSMLSFSSAANALTTTTAATATGTTGTALTLTRSGSEGLISINGMEGVTVDASGRVAPDVTGWLKKKNGLNAWQPRYFELKGNRLYYFSSESDGLPRGAIVLDHAHVLRGKGEQSMTFTITASGAQQSLQLLKFSSRMTHQVHPRKSCVLRVVHETEESVSTWITALNRASFYCNLSTTSSSGSQSSSSAASPARNQQQQQQQQQQRAAKRRNPFYRLRAASSSSLDSDDGPHSTTTTTSASPNDPMPSSTTATGSGSGSGSPGGGGYHHYGSVKYLQETDPLLWEIHPHDQQRIRKRAAVARTRGDYLAILSKYSATFRQIFLPKPRPITLEQTLRDILPELFSINNVLYGGGDDNNGLENIFEVLDTCIKRFASAQDERVRAVSALLQACARTISGGDSYFVVHSLLGNPSMIIRPAEARGHPIELEVSPRNPCQFRITVFSAFSFHHIEDVEHFGESQSHHHHHHHHPEHGHNAMPEPLLRVQTYHVQEFDFGTGKSSRWLRIRSEGMKDADLGSEALGGGVYQHGGSPTTTALGIGTTVLAGTGPTTTPHHGHGHATRSSWLSTTKRSASETGFGALLDALS